MGWGAETHRSTLAEPPSPERMRPPAGALLYCLPEEDDHEPAGSMALTAPVLEPPPAAADRTATAVQ